MPVEGRALTSATMKTNCCRPRVRHKVGDESGTMHFRTELNHLSAAPY
jgi:hypothetical protein